MTIELKNISDNRRGIQLNTLTDNELSHFHDKLQDEGIDMWLEGDANDTETWDDWNTAVDKVTQEIVNRFTMKHFESF